MRGYFYGKGNKYYSTCPDCGSDPCGLSKREHRHMERLRAQAERQAHQLVVQARERELLPRALIKEVYDKAEQDVRRQLGR